MGAATHILLINLTVLAIAAGGFLASWMRDRTRHSALWTAVSLVLLMGSGASSVLVLVAEHPAIRLLIHGLTFAGLVALLAGLRLQYGHRAGVAALTSVLLAGLGMLALGVAMPRMSVAHGVLLNGPGFVAGVLIALSVLRAPDRDALDGLVSASAFVIAAQFVYRPLMMGMGIDLPPTVAGFFSSDFGLHILTVQCVVTILTVASISLVHVRDTVRSLERATARDPLTGLLNRRGLDAAVDAITQRKQRSFRPVSVVVTDIDRFKTVNDTHGHDVGDHVIRALARLLDGTARPDDVVARMGGEEFVVVMSDASPDLARLFAEGVRIALSEMPQATGGRITASFGVAELMPGMTVAEAISAADMALYEAKRAGRNRVRIAQPRLDDAHERRLGEHRGTDRRRSA